MSATVLALLAAAIAAPAGPARAAEPFVEGMVSITFDDAYASQATLALPELASRGQRGTFYLITDALSNWTNYLTIDQAKQLAAAGHEIGSHTVSHPDLTTLSDADLLAELADSQTWLVANLGLTDVQSFASPGGSYDLRVMGALWKFYGSHRTVHWVRNYRDTNRMELGGFTLGNSTVVDTVKGWIDRAVAERSWLILYAHDLVNRAPRTSNELRFSDFKAILDYIALVKVKVVTVREGVALMLPPAPPPSLRSISTSRGSTVGGTQVTLSGGNILPGATALFGSTAAVSLDETATMLDVATPAHGAGTVDVGLYNPDGQYASLPSAFTFVAPPSIASVSPVSGPAAGGTSVTLSGSGFASGAIVSIGNAGVTPTSVSATRIVLVTPARAAGSVDVVVTNPDGQSSRVAGGFTYLAPPVLTSVTPASGPVVGGLPVTLRGSAFRAGATVSFGGVAASVRSVSASALAVTAPAHSAGAVDVAVTNSDGQSITLAGAFTYVPPPTLLQVTPARDRVAGGATLTLQGTGFRPGVVVRIGDLSVTPSTQSATALTLVSPPHPSATVDVAVANPDGQSAALPGAFTYVGPPTVVSVSPASGPVTGATAVSISGAGFDAPTVTFGGVAASVVRATATALDVLTPAGAVGAVDVTVRNADGQQATLARAYVYQPGPGPTPTPTPDHVVPGPPQEGSTPSPGTPTAAAGTGCASAGGGVDLIGALGLTLLVAGRRARGRPRDREP